MHESFLNNRFRRRDLNKRKMKIFVMFPFLVTICFGEQKRFQMPTGAIEPTIKSGSHVVVDTKSYQKNVIERWDLVLYRAPENVRLYGTNPKTLPPYVIRIVGLPGETIEFGGKTVMINGKELKMPRSLDGLSYSGLGSFPPDASKMKSPPKIILSDTEYFVLGDRTAWAVDSRFWGPLQKSNIIGKVVRVE